MSLPITLDPFKYADQQRVLEGELELSTLPQLVELLAKTDGIVRLKLVFSRDAHNFRIIEGEISATLSLDCQRCLEPLPAEIHSEFTLGLLRTDEQAQNLPKAYEPLLVESEIIELAKIIEDELILSLPMFSDHDECPGVAEGVTRFSGGEDAQEHESEVRPNPFSVLSGLKLKDKQSKDEK